MDDEALSELAQSGSPELALFARLGRDAVVPTRIVSVASAASDVTEPGRVHLVRTAQPADRPFFGATLTARSEDALLVRDVGALFAEAAFGTSPSRFSAILTKQASPDEIEDALGRLALPSLGRALPPLAERLAFLVERALARSATAMVLHQTLEPTARRGHLVTRDLRSGGGPPRGQVTDSLRGLVEPLTALVPVTEIAQLEQAHRDRLASLASLVEAELKQPARIAFQVGSRGVEVVAITPLAHSGRAAVALAADLVDRGVLKPEDALRIVSPRDLATALEFRLEPDAAQIVGRGVAAGGGIAIGHACLSAAGAEAFERADLSPVLFVEELVPEDSRALGLSQGVVTVRGGITGEAAIMARALAKPCVASGPTLTLAGGSAVAASGLRIEPGDRVAIDGATGLIVRGPCRRSCDLPAGAARLLEWAAAYRSGTVIATVSHPYDIACAAGLGADAFVVLVPEALALSTGRKDAFESLLLGLEALLEAASDGRTVYVNAQQGTAPLLLKGLTNDAVARAIEEAGRRTGRSVPSLGAGGVPPLWRGGDDPGGPVIAFADPANLEGAAGRVVQAPGGAMACAPKHVPAARLALARAALGAGVFTDPT